jgi:hypothetical protein
MLVPEIRNYAEEDQRLGWLLLMWVSSVAGNLTLVGSVANLIVAERAKECSRQSFELRFVEYLKFGFPSTVICLLLGTACTSFTAASIPRFSPVPPPPQADFDPYRPHALVPTPGDRPGLFFIGLSLSQNHSGVSTGSASSVSRQTQFDFNRIQDRDYVYLQGTNDDGWLVGGGEGGASEKLPNPDSAHIEILHVGTTDNKRGGMSFAEVDAILSSMDVEPIRLKPSKAALNDDSPAEWELVFTAKDNPTLAAVQAELREKFNNRLRELPDKFHMSIARKLAFRSPKDEKGFLDKAQEEVARWRSMYPDGTILTPDRNTKGITQQEVDQPGGLYLFGNRNSILRYYPPS